MRGYPRIILALALATLAGSATAQSNLVLADGGVVFEARSGTYGSLFDDDALPASVRVLVLDAIEGDERTRHLVPETGDPAIDHRPVLLYDRTFDAVNVVWEQQGVDDTIISLARFDADGWSDVSTLLVRPTETASGSSHTLTRDAHSWITAGGPSPLSDRSILHLAWAEGGTDVRYAPLIFIDGAFAGWSDSFSLLDLFESDPDTPTGSPTDALANALALDLGADGQHIQATLVDPRSGHVTVLRIGIQPLDLAFFAAEIRLGLAALTDLYQAGSATAIQGPLRSTIIASGASLGLDVSIVTYVANTVNTWAEAWTALNPDADFEAFSADLLSFVNDLTLALFTGATDGQIIELDLDGTVSGATQLFEVHVTSTHPAPVTGNGLHRLFTSADGTRMLVAWHEPSSGSVRYVESTGDDADPWTPTAEIRLDSTMTPERIDPLLRQRLR